MQRGRWIHSECLEPLSGAGRGDLNSIIDSPAIILLNAQLDFPTNAQS